MTAALERGGWVATSTPRPHFSPGKYPVPILQEAGWAPGPVWTGGKSRPHRDSIPDRPARSSVAIPTELPAPPTHYIYIYIYIYIYNIWLNCANYEYIQCVIVSFFTLLRPNVFTLNEFQLFQKRCANDKLWMIILKRFDSYQEHFFTNDLYLTKYRV